MKVRKVSAGEVVAKRQDKVMEWYLIQEGAVAQVFEFAEILLERNSMIGILENEWFMCDYVARQDTTLIVIACKDASDLEIILSEHENYRAIFLRAALEQKHKALYLYMDLMERSTLLHAYAESAYGEYKSLCAQLFARELPFPRMESFQTLSLVHRADNWEINSNQSLMQHHLKEYLGLMIKEDALCVGAILEAAAQVRRVSLGISEMVNYLLYNKDIFWSESGNDLFHLFFDLAVQASREKKDVSGVQKELERCHGIMTQIGLYSEKQLEQCRKTYQNFDYESVSEGRIDVTTEDCVAHIMNYAGYEAGDIVAFKELLAEFRSLEDPFAMDSTVFALRKKIAGSFYEIYSAAFLHSMEDIHKPSPILLMFFNFGFMDTELMGDENSNALYNLTDHLDVFNSEHVYTIYEWLKGVYDGTREASRNEFDLDFYGYLMDLRKNGNITDEQMQVLRKNPKVKVEFEIHNMFQSVHRMTYGRMTTFFPILRADEFLNSVERMALTAERVKTAINNVRALDYSVLYREVLFSDPVHNLQQEWIMKEVMPDIVLMPCAGTKGVMWQETCGAKTNTPARFMLPIFTAVDVDEQMIEIMGRYRWEICRRVQGVYWNDIREKSLTAEYYDYMQFYRKNSDLSTDAKEKIKLSLQRARNSYREVFVKDYQIWMKYEAKGSFRLNKVSRAILTKYCPFSRSVRQSLSSNPLYQNAFAKLDGEQKRRELRLNALYEKYQAAGGVITADLRENINYCQL